MVIFHGKLSKIARGHNFTHIYHRQTHSSSSPFVNYQYKSIIIKHHQSSSTLKKSSNHHCPRPFPQLPTFWDPKNVQHASGPDRSWSRSATLWQSLSCGLNPGKYQSNVAGNSTKRMELCWENPLNKWIPLYIEVFSSIFAEQSIE